MVRIMPSRRELIAAAGAFLSTSAAGAVAQQQSGQIATQDLAVAGRVATLTCSTDATFGVQLDTCFPGLSKDPNFQAIAPLAVLVTNTTGPNIQALGLTWSVAAADGVFQQSMYFYRQASATNLMSGLRRFLPTNETSLVTPFFARNSAQFQANPVINWDFVMTRGGIQEMFMARDPNRASSIQIMPDAAVYTDWVVTGPDHAGLGSHLHIRRNAEHDEAIALLKLLKAHPNASSSLLDEKLRQDRTIAGASGNSGRKRDPQVLWYWQARSLQARMLYKRFKAGNSAGFIECLMFLRNQPRVTVRAVNA